MLLLVVLRVALEYAKVSLEKKKISKVDSLFPREDKKGEWIDCSIVFVTDEIAHHRRDARKRG